MPLFLKYGAHFIQRGDSECFVETTIIWNSNNSYRVVYSMKHQIFLRIYDKKFLDNRHLHIVPKRHNNHDKEDD